MKHATHSSNYNHNQSRSTRIPSLENWDGGLKSLLRLACTPCEIVSNHFAFHMNVSSFWQGQCTHWRLGSVAIGSVWNVPVCHLSVVEGGDGGLGFLCLLLVLL